MAAWSVVETASVLVAWKDSIEATVKAVLKVFESAVQRVNFWAVLKVVWTVCKKDVGKAAEWAFSAVAKTVEKWVSEMAG